jgi:hypothetical protein
MSMRDGNRTRSPLALAALAGASLVSSASCGGDLPDPHDDASCVRELNDPDNADAIEWLKAPSAHPKRLGNLTADQGLAFASRLEALGARRIVAVLRSKAKGASSPEGAVGLVVQLPDDPRNRLAVFRLYSQQIRTVDYAPRPDTGQKYLYIPWTRDDGGS